MELLLSTREREAESEEVAKPHEGRSTEQGPAKSCSGGDDVTIPKGSGDSGEGPGELTLMSSGLVQLQAVIPSRSGSNFP